MITPWVKRFGRVFESKPAGRSPRRGRRVAHPRLESLEGRALMATATLDPTFGQAGFVTGLLDNGKGLDNDNAAALAVDKNGKTVVAGFAGIGGTSKLAVRRFNVDGSLDTTFGTNGETNPPLPGSPNAGFANPVSLSIGGDGSIALVTRSFGSSTTSTVVQLTPGGQLDAGFGTNGEYSLEDGSGAHTELYSVAVQPDGKIIAAGVRYNGSTTAEDQLLAIRLTTTGTLDTTFNGSGIQTLHVPGVMGVDSSNAQVSLLGSSLAVAPSGQIYLGTNLYGTLNTSISGTSRDVARLNADGTLDTSFAAYGYLSLSADMTNTLYAIAVQADNKLIVAGKINNIYGDAPTLARPTTPFLIRYLPNGVADPLFHAIPISTASTQTGPREVFTSIALGTDGSITVGGYRTRTTSADQFLAARFTATGQVSQSFGAHGRMTFKVPAYPNTGISQNVINVALTPSDNVVLLGGIYGGGFNQLSVLARLTPTLILNNATNDFDGDGKSDAAAELTSDALFAYRKSNGTGDVIQQFGQAGVGASIPALGDYDGDGKPDIAVYLPRFGFYAYRPSGGGGDVVQGFGRQGLGQTITASSILYGVTSPVPRTFGLNSFAATQKPEPAVFIPLVDDLTGVASATAKKKTRASTA